MKIDTVCIDLEGMDFLENDIKYICKAARRFPHHYFIDYCGESAVVLFTDTPKAKWPKWRRQFFDAVNNGIGFLFPHTIEAIAKDTPEAAIEEAIALAEIPLDELPEYEYFGAPKFLREWLEQNKDRIPGPIVAANYHIT